MSFLYLFIILLCSSLVLQTNAANNFSTYYYSLWGKEQTVISPDEVTIQLDNKSGAGFRSKFQYGSGLFHIRMKIPDKKTEGVITSFYLTSAPDFKPLGNHMEVDFEFIGTNGTLQTNVYLNEPISHREQSFKLWFDPSKDFHTYEILWNSHQLVWVVDKIPIRVFRNNAAKGIAFPNVPMQIEASIWNADWAGPVDWSKVPFIAHYTDFDFYGCQAHNGLCDSSKFFWNRPQYWELNPHDKNLMTIYRKKYMSYNYCSKPSTAKPECSLNN